MTAAANVCWRQAPDLDATSEQYTGGDLPAGTVIACETAPWIEDAKGTTLDLDDLDRLLTAAGNPTLATPKPNCDCAGDGPFVGMHVSEFGNIERHDECALYPGDLEAAYAIATAIGGTVWYYPEPIHG